MTAVRRGLLLAVLAVAACAPDHGEGYPARFAEAERAETAGRYEEASERYAQAAKEAVRERDKGHALYLSALMLLHAGKLEEGIAKLEKIRDADPPTPHAADAAHRIALTRIVHGKDEARGYAELEKLVTRFPNSGAAHPALRQVLARKDEGPGGAAESLAYLRLLEPILAKTEVGELVHFEIAERLAATGETARAREAFIETAERWPYPRGSLWDDALLRASELDEKLGRPELAVQDLDRMLEQRETTYLVGSYQRPMMSRALFRKGVLYAEKLQDHARARATFHRLYTDFTTSRLRDDALWFEATLARADGDPATACARLSTLTREFPDSRYVPCAVEDGDASCHGEIARAAKSQAPKACHAYLRREGRGLPSD